MTMTTTMAADAVEWAGAGGGSLGLDPEVEGLYRVMLGGRHWERGELAERLGWSLDVVDERMRELVAEGLATDSAEAVGRVRAVEPCVALPALAARRFRGVAPEAPAAVKAVGGRRQGQGAFAGLDDAAAFVERMVAGVEGEVVHLVPSCPPGAFEFSRHIAEAVLRRGAVLRAVWASSVLEHPAAAEHASWLAMRWAPPRVVEVVPMRVTLVDGIAAVVHDEDGHVGVIRGAKALDSLTLLADRLWERGAEVGAVRARAAGRPPDARNEMVLRLLADGLTDDAIARRIGVSVRTVRSDVAESMTRLKARSRFQAGVRAVQLGLI